MSRVRGNRENRSRLDQILPLTMVLELRTVRAIQEQTEASTPTEPPQPTEPAMEEPAVTDPSHRPPQREQTTALELLPTMALEPRGRRRPAARAASSRSHTCGSLRLRTPRSGGSHSHKPTAARPTASQTDGIENCAAGSGAGDAEQVLRSSADPDAAEWVDATLRTLAAACRRHERNAPRIAAVRVLDHGTELVLGSPSVAEPAMPPFEDHDADRRGSFPVARSCSTKLRLILGSPVWT